MLEGLAGGKVPLLRYAGKGFGYPYWSNTMRRIEATWVHVPPSYGPGKSYQLFLLLQVRPWDSPQGRQGRRRLPAR